MEDYLSVFQKLLARENAVLLSLSFFLSFIIVLIFLPSHESYIIYIACGFFVVFKTIIKGWKEYCRWNRRRIINSEMDRNIDRVFDSLSEEQRKILQILINKGTQDKNESNVRQFNRNAETLELINRAISFTTYNRNRYGYGSECIHMKQTTESSIVILFDKHLYKLIRNWSSRN